MIEEMNTPDENAAIPWTGDRCGSCKFWVREDKNLAPGIGNCVRLPPEPHIVMIPGSQPRMLKGIIQHEPAIQIQVQTIQRATRQNEGCGEHKPRS